MFNNNCRDVACMFVCMWSNDSGMNNKEKHHFNYGWMNFRPIVLLVTKRFKLDKHKDQTKPSLTKMWLKKL